MTKKILSFAASTLFLVGCGAGAGTPASQSPAPTDGDTPTLESTPTAGGEIVFAQASAPPTLDPHGTNDSVSNETMNQIFETLTTFDGDGQLIPWLATSFEAITDTTWEFVLRQGVSFHDGDPFDSYAVYRSLNRVLDPTLASPRHFIVNMIAQVQIVDTYTLHIETYYPFSPLPAHLAHLVGGIISPSSLDRELAGGYTISEFPVGTGPFTFVSHTPGEEVRMARNDNYWGDAPAIETLRFVVVPEPSTRFNMLLTGEAHVTRPSAVDASLIRDDANLSLMEIPSSRLNYIGFNTLRPPFDDIRVRQAIAMVTDLDAIVEAIDGMGIPAVGPLSPIVTGAPSDLAPITGTVEDALALLAEAGFPDGFSTVISLGANRPLEEPLTAQIFQANLASIGITASIQEIEWGAYLDYTGAGNHEIFILGWTTVTGDADYGLFPLFHTDQAGIPGNRTFYSNPRVDYLLTAARQTADQALRNELYAEASQILAYEVPMIYTFYNTFMFATHGISGLFADFNGTPSFRQVVLD